jgi:hypothetical protein
VSGIRAFAPIQSFVAMVEFEPYKALWLQKETPPSRAIRLGI